MWSDARLNVLVFNQPVDMRRGFEGLMALCSQVMHCNVFSGDVFVFVGRRRTRIKCLMWDGTGICIWHKRLEQGHFAAPWKSSPNGPWQLTRAELLLLLHGAEHIRVQPSAMDTTKYSAHLPAQSLDHRDQIQNRADT